MTTESTLQFEALMNQHGIRPTANRLIVIKALSDETRPQSLAELEERLVTLDKSSIFRTLTLFREKHLVHAIENGNNTVVYELCLSHDHDTDDDAHVHFFCERCQNTFCLHDINIPPVTLPEGYSMATATYLIKGLCPDCRK